MSKKLRLKRRDFLATTAAAISAPYFVPASALALQGRVGPNDRVIVGHIGFGGRAKGLYRELGSLRDEGQAASVAVCDIDEKRLEDGAKNVAPGAFPYRDYRYILDRKDIDAVVIGTPDHWHGVQFVHSAEAASTSTARSRPAARSRKARPWWPPPRRPAIATQIGSQGRSQPEAYLMHRYLKNVLGKVSHVECFHYPSPEDTVSTVRTATRRPNWIGTCGSGPLRWRPYNKRYLHGSVPLDDGVGRRPDPRPRRARDELRHVVDGRRTAQARSPSRPPAPRPSKGLWDAAVLMNVKYTFKNPDWVLTWTQMPMDEVKRQVPGRGADRGRGKAVQQDLAGPATAPSTTAKRGPACTGAATAAPGPNARCATGTRPRASRTSTRAPATWRTGSKASGPARRRIMNIDAGAGVANLCVLGNLVLHAGTTADLGSGQTGNRRRRTGPSDDEPPAAPSLSPVGVSNDSRSPLSQDTSSLG